MQTKCCALCGETKPAEAFPKNKASRDGLYRLCKACNAAKLKARNDSKEYKAKRAGYLSVNRETVNRQSMESYYRHHELSKARMLARRNANKEERIKAAKEWRKVNPERVKTNRDRWFDERPGYMNERGMRRYASKKSATPPWADIEKIREVYALAKEMRQSGLDVNVDHIVPLRGKGVSGLHVHWNLRIILAKHNRAKSNLWQ